MTSVARIKEKDIPKEGKIKFKPLVEAREVKSLLEGSGSPVKIKPTASKGATPGLTTAATSRQTQSPSRPAERSQSAAQRNSSVSKIGLSTPVPKGLKSAVKSRFGSSGSKFAKKYKIDLLGIHELIDIDMKKFEKDNKTRLSYILTTLMGKNDSAKKKSVEKSSEKTDRSKSLSKLKPLKKRVSDVHLNVGLGKRVDPVSDDDRREARIKWEKINIKKDHLKKFTEKDKRYRVL